MADSKNNGGSAPPSVDWMTRAATEFANAGFRYLFGNPVAPEHSSASDTWITRLLAQHRTGLGELLSIAPAVLERNTKLVDSLTGRRVLYRAGGLARDASSGDLLTPLTGVIAKLAGPCIASPLVVALQRKRSAVLQRAPKAAKVAKHLLSPTNRLDLPATLEELKHFARRNRSEGWAEVARRLQFVKENEEHVKAAVELIDGMRDVLGQNCFAEILRLGLEDAYLDPQPANPAACDAIDIAYKPLLGQLGFPSEKADPACLSILTARSAPHVLRNSYFTYFILDHQRDVVYEVRGASRGQTFTEIELYGPVEGRNYDVNGDRFRLPFRVADASQAFATWSVDRGLIQDELDARGRGMSRPKLRAADVGADRTLLALSFIDYRDSDLKEPAYELVLAALVAPEDDPLAIGLFPLATILVSSEENMELGKEAWGFPKECVAQNRSGCSGLGAWTVQYRPSALSCSVTLNASANLAIDVTFPRGGEAASPPIPLAWYTHKNGHWHRSILTRSGTGESVRIGRSGFSLRIQGIPAGNSATATARRPDSIPDWLYFAGIVDPDGICIRPPMNTGWTEHFTASISPAVLLPRPTREPT